MISRGPDLPPLLPTGFHSKSLAEIWDLCVTHFRGMSRTREGIMKGLEGIVDRLAKAGVAGEIWVNGSFLTEKIDPEDVDILLHVQADFYNAASNEVRDAIDWVDSNLKATHKADSYVWREHQWRPGDPDYWEADWDRSYWIRQFGFSREDEYKGMALIVLPGVTAP